MIKLIDILNKSYFKTEKINKDLLYYIIYELILRKDILINNEGKLIENKNPPLEPLRFLLYPKRINNK